MRTLAWVLLGTVACGGNNSAQNDAPPEVDAPIDAPVLPPCAAPVAGTNVTTRLIGNINDGQENDAALLVTAPAGDTRLFVVGRTGKIHIFENEQKLAQPFLDLSPDNDGPVLSGNEQGLLGLAFHPQYHKNRTFFVFYTKRQVPTDNLHPFRNVVARCETMAADPNRADPASCVEILSIKDFAANHNGGMVEFGPDGKLYIGTGDGGNANDPDGNAQTLTDGQPVARSIALLGKILRIDVDNKDAGKEYGVPADNPFIGSGAPEVYALGLRNPWRFSFDRMTGDIWIGDVGQDESEELNVVKAGELAGKNFGWDIYESNNCFAGRGPSGGPQPACPDAAGKTFPVDVRTHTGDGWVSIIGGQVYRGTCYPDIVGNYYYADHNAGGLVQATLNPDGTISKQDLAGNLPNGVSSIHEDASGELYMTIGANGGGGNVFHIEVAP